MCVISGIPNHFKQSAVPPTAYGHNALIRQKSMALREGKLIRSLGSSALLYCL